MERVRKEGNRGEGSSTRQPAARGVASSGQRGWCVSTTRFRLCRGADSEGERARAKSVGGTDGQRRRVRAHPNNPCPRRKRGRGAPSRAFVCGIVPWTVATAGTAQSRILVRGQRGKSGGQGGAGWQGAERHPRAREQSAAGEARPAPNSDAAAARHVATGKRASGGGNSRVGGSRRPRGRANTRAHSEAGLGWLDRRPAQHVPKKCSSRGTGG